MSISPSERSHLATYAGQTSDVRAANRIQEKNKHLKESADHLDAFVKRVVQDRPILAQEILASSVVQAGQLQKSRMEPDDPKPLKNLEKDLMAKIFHFLKTNANVAANILAINGSKESDTLLAHLTPEEYAEFQALLLSAHPERDPKFVRLKNKIVLQEADRKMRADTQLKVAVHSELNVKPTDPLKEGKLFRTEFMGLEHKVNQVFGKRLMLQFPELFDAENLKSNQLFIEMLNEPVETAEFAKVWLDEQALSQKAAHETVNDTDAKLLPSLGLLTARLNYMANKKEKTGLLLVDPRQDETLRAFLSNEKLKSHLSFKPLQTTSQKEEMAFLSRQVALVRGVLSQNADMAAYEESLKNKHNLSDINGQYLPVHVLGNFIKEHNGVCIHHAALNKLILDQLPASTIETSIKSGYFEVEKFSKIVPLKSIPLSIMGHLWNTVTFPSGRKYLLDSGNRLVLPLRSKTSLDVPSQKEQALSQCYLNLSRMEKQGQGEQTIIDHLVESQLQKLLPAFKRASEERAKNK